MEQQRTACPLTKGEQILVGVDGSGYSEKALDQAISMAKICNSTLFAISVIDLFPGSLQVAPALAEKMGADARKVLEKAKYQAEKRAYNVRRLCTWVISLISLLFKRQRKEILTSS
jgi:nucleotide-binding universal stress UspA family protein